MRAHNDRRHLTFPNVSLDPSQSRVTTNLFAKAVEAHTTGVPFATSTISNVMRSKTMISRMKSWNLRKLLIRLSLRVTVQRRRKRRLQKRESLEPKHSRTVMVRDFKRFSLIARHPDVSFQSIWLLLLAPLLLWARVHPRIPLWVLPPPSFTFTFN